MNFFESFELKNEIQFVIPLNERQPDRLTSKVYVFFLFEKHFSNADYKQLILPNHKNLNEGNFIIASRTKTGCINLKINSFWQQNFSPFAVGGGMFESKSIAAKSNPMLALLTLLGFAFVLSSS